MKEEGKILWLVSAYLTEWVTFETIDELDFDRFMATTW